MDGVDGGGVFHNSNRFINTTDIIFIFFAKTTPIKFKVKRIRINQSHGCSSLPIIFIQRGITINFKIIYIFIRKFIFYTASHFQNDLIRFFSVTAKMDF